MRHRPDERIADIAPRLAVTAVIALVAHALLHQLARDVLGAFAQPAQRIALFGERAAALLAAQCIGGALHGFAGLAEGWRRLHALLAELRHQLFQHAAERLLLAGEVAGLGRGTLGAFLALSILA